MAKRVRRRRPTVTITLNAELLKRADAVADAEGVSRSEFLERLVADGIDQAETVARAFNNPIITRAWAEAVGKPGVLQAMVSVLGEQLDDNQLKLFKTAMAAVTDIGEQGSKPHLVKKLPDIPPAVSKSLAKKVAKSFKRR